MGGHGQFLRCLQKRSNANDDQSANMHANLIAKELFIAHPYELFTLSDSKSWQNPKKRGIYISSTVLGIQLIISFEPHLIKLHLILVNISSRMRHPPRRVIEVLP